MLALARAATPWGIDAHEVGIELDVAGGGLPTFHIVGLPDAAVRESQKRVESAVKNSGFKIERRAVVLNLAPANLRKEGSHLDLAIALALLAAHERIPGEVLANRLICGELGLDGTVRPIRGALAVADLGRRLQVEELLVPAVNAGEAAALEGIGTIGVSSLAETVEHLMGIRPLARATASAHTGAVRPLTDLAEVRGQELARRALEIAAAGGHNLLFTGPPGSGKTLLARCLPGILPPLSSSEAIEVTKIHSVAGLGTVGLVTSRPLRAPHASISLAGLVGGGAIPRPGEVTLAHSGVLFLDELPEFRRDALEALRQPMEDGTVTVCRAQARITFPARFALVAAMNPCRCGYLGDPRHECRCTPGETERYRNRISGPLLDRIDLQIEVPAISLGELKGPPGEPTEAVAERVAAARERQRFRFGSAAPIAVNAILEGSLLRRHCELDAAARGLLDAAFDKLSLSARAVTRILKVARTITDLRGSERLAAADVAEAIQYRTLDRRLAG